MRYGAQGILRHYGLENRSVVMFLLASFLVQSTMGALNVILNLYILELGFTEEYAGMLLSVKLFTTGLVCIPAGIFCARLGVRRVLIMASGALGLGVIILSLTSNPLLLSIGAVLVGSAQAAKAVSVPLFLVENSSPRIRQNLFSLNFSMMMFANMAGNAMSGYLPMLWVNSLSGYIGTLQVYGAMALVSVLPLAFIASKGQTSAESIGSQLFQGLQLLRENKSMGRLMLCHAVVGFGAGLIVPLFNIFLSNRLGASSGQIGVIMSIAQVGTAIGGLLVPFIVARLGRVATVVVLRFASIPFLILIATLTNIYGVGAVFFLRSALMNMTNPVESNFAMEMVGQKRRAVWSSLLKTMDTLTRGFSVLAGGWLMARFDYSVPYFFTCGLYLVTVVAYWYWFKPLEQTDKQITAAV